LELTIVIIVGVFVNLHGSCEVLLHHQVQVVHESLGQAWEDVSWKSSASSAEPSTYKNTVSISAVFFVCIASGVQCFMLDFHIGDNDYHDNDYNSNNDINEQISNHISKQTSKETQSNKQTNKQSSSSSWCCGKETDGKRHIRYSNSPYHRTGSGPWEHADRHLLSRSSLPEPAGVLAEFEAEKNPWHLRTERCTWI
jgi:hypothetical protein